MYLIYQSLAAHLPMPVQRRSLRLPRRADTIVHTNFHIEYDIYLEEYTQ